MYILNTPITLGTLHIDMAIKLATEKELENLNKQWKRSLVVTKLTMKEAQIVSIDDKEIISKIDNVLKIDKDLTIVPFGMIEIRGVIKTPNHYKCVNVVVDNLLEGQHCKDIAIAKQIQFLKPGSNKIPVVLRNSSCRTLKLKKGTKVAHVEGSCVVSPMINSRISENILKKDAGNAPKSTLLENVSKAQEERIKEILKSLNLQSIESWNEQ